MIASLANQVKPFAIVDADRSLRSLLKESDRDPLQSLPSETAIKVIDPELDRLAQNPVEIVEMMPVFLGLLLDSFCQ